jgi:hypothetical protein
VHRVSVIGVRWPTRPSGAAIGEMNPVQGMSGRPNPYSIRDMMTKHEIAYRARVPRGAAPRRRRPRSSRRAGKPPTRRRGSGGPTFRPWRYTTCGSPKAVVDVAEWLPESRALGNLYTRLGGGRRRRGCEATAPTAHPTRGGSATEGFKDAYWDHQPSDLRPWQRR